MRSALQKGKGAVRQKENKYRKKSALCTKGKTNYEKYTYF